VPGKLRVLSGFDVVRILAQFGFQQIGQRGSHVKLRRDHLGNRQTLHIPMHRELRPGTLRSIYQQALNYVPETDLRLHFYSD
jgi:predicted RNA binding protein YcfA (HicA-like mRNA interferase family)